MSSLHLKPGHVQPVWAGHPWIYAQAIQKLEGGASAGDEVSVFDPRGNLLGRGFYSPTSAIPVRILARDADTPIDKAFFRAKLERAIAHRKRLGLPDAREGSKTDGYRLVHAEGDGLPGLIVDRFGDVLTVQLSTCGMKVREAMILDALEELLAPKAILDRTPAAMAKREGFIPSQGVVRGALAGAKEGESPRRSRSASAASPTRCRRSSVRRRGFTSTSGSARAWRRWPRGRVLDAYGFVGPFALAAARGGAEEVLRRRQHARLGGRRRVRGSTGRARDVHEGRRAQDAARRGERRLQIW